MSSVPRYPLEWPITTPRTRPSRRKPGAFRAHKAVVSVAEATRRLEAQVSRLGGTDATLSTNVELRLDGRPRSDREPVDPGAALYFSYQGRATVFACDRFTRLGANIAAIAGHIDALRRVERYGVGTIEQALLGYRALPADTAAHWRNVFGFGLDQVVGLAEVDTAYRRLAKLAHPDQVGSDEAMSHLNRAREYARRDLASEAR